MQMTDKEKVARLEMALEAIIGLTSVYEMRQVAVKAINPYVKQEE